MFALALAPYAAWTQQSVKCQGGRCVQMFSGKCPVGRQLRVNAHGPVTVEAGAPGSNDLFYTARVMVRAGNEVEARRLLSEYSMPVASQGGWSVVTVPGEPLASEVVLRAPRLTAVSVVTTDGPVDVSGVDGSLDVDTVAGPLTADRIRGDCRLSNRGGDIRIGEVAGAVNATTGFGTISVRAALGRATLQTMGGDIIVQSVAGPLHAESGAGQVRIENAGGEVEAVNGGGPIWIGAAKGVVTAHNMAGAVHIGAAAGVRCESAAGAVRLGGIAGSMRVSTVMGSIMATLMGARPGDSYLTTGNGDITVVIPSNVGVTIQAENEMADTLRRIISEFPQIQVRRQGMRLVAEGRLNGGGPVLRISSMVGTILIKRQ